MTNYLSNWICFQSYLPSNLTPWQIQILFLLVDSYWPVAITSDISLHGTKPEMSREFIEEARAAKPLALICERRDCRLANIGRRAPCLSDCIVQLLEPRFKPRISFFFCGFPQVLVTALSRDVHSINIDTNAVEELVKIVNLAPFGAW